MIIGIDPGKSGGVAFWHEGIDKVVKCPNNVNDMYSIVKQDPYDSCAYIEKVWARPSNATRAAFTFGVNYGEWLAILAALELKTTLITPQTWMKYYKEKFKFKLPKEKKDRKNKLKKIATYYTDKKVTLYNADAILIAFYGFIQENK